MVQFVFTFPPVWQHAIKDSPEVRRMIIFMEVDKLMGNDIIYKKHRQLKEFPVEMKDTVFSARTPSETQIPDHDF